MSSRFSRVVFIVRSHLLDTAIDESALCKANERGLDFLFRHVNTRGLKDGWVLYDWERVEWDPTKFEYIHWLNCFMESLFPVDYKFLSMNELHLTLERRGDAEEPFGASPVAYIHYE